MDWIDKAGFALTLFSSVAVVIWRFSALSAKLENVATKLSELAQDMKASRAQHEVFSTRLAVVEFRVDRLISDTETLVKKSLERD